MLDDGGQVAPVLDAREKVNAGYLGAVGGGEDAGGGAVIEVVPIQSIVLVSRGGILGCGAVSRGWGGLGKGGCDEKRR